MRELLGRKVAAASFTALSNDTTGIAVSTTRLWGTNSIEFDKVDGTDNKTYAGCYMTLTEALNSPLDKGWDRYAPHDRICWVCYVSATTNVASSFVRLGTNGMTNYYEWRYADSNMQAGWNMCHAKLGHPVLGGTGFDPDDIDTLAVGVNFDAEGNALANIKFNAVYLEHAKVVEDD